MWKIERWRGDKHSGRWETVGNELSVKSAERKVRKLGRRGAVRATCKDDPDGWCEMRGGPDSFCKLRYLA